MGERYDIRHSKGDPAEPISMGIPSLFGVEYNRCDIHDKETHTSATGWGNSRDEALENALKELDRKRGI